MQFIEGFEVLQDNKRRGNINVDYTIGNSEQNSGSSIFCGQKSRLMKRLMNSTLLVIKRLMVDP